MRHVRLHAGHLDCWAPRLANRDGRNKSGHDVSVSLDLANSKRQQFFVFTSVFELIAGLVQKIRNIDAGQRIGAFDDQHIAGLRLAQRFAGA